MLNYIIRRLIVSVFMLIGIGMVSFAVIQLPPGDAASSYQNFLINNAGMTQEEAETAADAVRARYGLDQPLPAQFATWIKGIVTKGEFGFSFAYRRDAGEIIKERLPKTLMIAMLAHLISTVVGLGLGIYAAPRKYGVADNFLSVVAFVLSSIPRFWMALVLMYVLVFTFGRHHITSFFSPQYVVAPWSWAKFADMIQHIWPVVLIAGLGGVARNMRVMRGNLLDTLNTQYVTTARSKGLTESSVINKHAVPNASHAIIAYQGTVLPYMLAGELEAAIVWNLPTLAPLFYDSLVTQDLYISGSLLLIYGAMIVIGNLISDILLAWYDPRIKYT
jgi:peptide/nickel transport system permease protein